MDEEDEIDAEDLEIRGAADMIREILLALPNRLEYVALRRVVLGDEGDSQNKAAKACNTSSATLSRRIKELRQRLHFLMKRKR